LKPNVAKSTIYTSALAAMSRLLLLYQVRDQLIREQMVRIKQQNRSQHHLLNQLLPQRTSITQLLVKILVRDIKLIQKLQN